MGKTLNDDNEDRALSLDEAIEIWLEAERSGLSVPRNIIANGVRTEARRLKQDLIEIAIEKADLDNFRMGSGRLNRRALAKNIQHQLLERNQSPHLETSRKLRNIGLRTIELVIKRWEEK